MRDIQDAGQRKRENMKGKLRKMEHEKAYCKSGWNSKTKKKNGARAIFVEIIPENS